MHFDWTINAGNVLTAVGLLIGFFVAHAQNIRKFQAMETKLGMIYDWFRNHIINPREGGSRSI